MPFFFFFFFAFAQSSLCIMSSNLGFNLQKKERKSLELAGTESERWKIFYDQPKSRGSAFLILLIFVLFGRIAFWYGGHQIFEFHLSSFLFCIERASSLFSDMLPSFRRIRVTRTSHARSLLHDSIRTPTSTSIFFQIPLSFDFGRLFFSWHFLLLSERHLCGHPSL